MKPNLSGCRVLVLIENDSGFVVDVAAATLPDSSFAQLPNLSSSPVPIKAHSYFTRKIVSGLVGLSIIRVGVEGKI